MRNTSPSTQSEPDKEDHSCRNDRIQKATGTRAPRSNSSWERGIVSTAAQGKEIEGTQGVGGGGLVKSRLGPLRYSVSEAREAREDRVLTGAAAQGGRNGGAAQERRRYLGREGEDHRQQHERCEQQHQQPPRAPHLLGHCRQRRHLCDRPAERASPGLPAPAPAPGL